MLLAPALLFHLHSVSQARPVPRRPLGAHLGRVVQTDAIGRTKCFVLVPLAAARGRPRDATRSHAEKGAEGVHS